MDDSENEEPIDPKLFTDPSPSPASDTHLAVLCDALQEHDVTRVIVCYDGSGDSGCVAGAAAHPDVPNNSARAAGIHPPLNRCDMKSPCDMS